MSSEKNIYSIAFYNVENLFDTINDPKTLDDDFTSDGKKKWNRKRYLHKIKKISSVISQLEDKKSRFAPAIVGLVEVENASVVEDLVNHPNLRKHHFDYVHYDSPDERGIDVALLYNKKIFELISSESFPLYVESREGERDYTRDILVVTGKLRGELIHVLVNHWPSRRDGADLTEYKRIKAAELARSIVDEIQSKTMNANIVLMGDFNDDPSSNSVKEHLVKDDFYNPMEKIHKKGLGTLTYDGKWNLFDQIIISNNFLEKENNRLHFQKAELYNKDWLKVFKGKYKGSPYRTYIGKWYQGGFSDHFPVCTYFRLKD